MGSRMAANLIKAGYQVNVWNRTASAADPLVKLGATLAQSVQTAIEGAEIIITMLSTPQVVAQVMNEEVLAAASGKLWIDASTVNPSFTRSIAVRAEKAGVRFMDTPVAGTKPHAENGELVFFVGGTLQDLEEAKPLLEVMGKKTLHLGEVSKGASFKMLVNLMLAQTMASFAETLLLGEKMGLDKAFLLKVLPGLVVTPPYVAAKVPMLEKDEFETMFPLEWMAKDLRLGMICAEEVGAPFEMGAKAEEVYQKAVEAGLGRLDFAGIYQYIKNHLH